MPENRNAISPSSAPVIDWDKVDAHVIQAEEYDELPELTDALLTQGVWRIGADVVSPDMARAAVAEAIAAAGRIEAWGQDDMGVRTETAAWLHDALEPALQADPSDYVEVSAEDVIARRAKVAQKLV
jgi:hypothetical protein